MACPILPLLLLNIDFKLKPTGTHLTHGKNGRVIVKKAYRISTLQCNRQKWM